MTRDDSSQSNPPSRFGFNSSLSTSGSFSASSKASSNQPDSNPSITTTSLSADTDTVEPFHMEISRRNLSMASMTLSAYSPLTLRSLPQPVPSDIPSNLDSSIFTFEDAFEDLLAVSQGQPLPDITVRHDQRKLLRSMFPDGEPAYFWLRRLRSQGLLDMPSPSQVLAQAADANWDYFHRELDRRAANVWRAVAGEDSRDSRDIFDDDDNFPGSFRENPRRRHREPDHFDDFFSSIQSSFSNPQSSWDSFVKSITDGPSTPIDKVQHDGVVDKNQEVTKDEYVDRFGYLHSKITVKTLDEDGNQIGTQTHYSFRPADKPSGDFKDDSKDEDKSGIHAEGRVETKTGWLWK
ncbi:hypothetical protein QQX98_011051 [Neonectria punicea]|uniref:ASX DEUBAD domain-containing protein n=1 Tax=Neonectria punicea TaxID=979145 RepID=A0ABR1GN48_9HYPO